jgi:IS605 OrfB family transposase
MELNITLKAQLFVTPSEAVLLDQVCEQYRQACNYVSEYIFNHEFVLNSNAIHKDVYSVCRNVYGLKSQLATSVPRTVTARYKAVKQQLFQKPWKMQDADGKWYLQTRDLNWLVKPIVFNRPQADLVRNRDYSFVKDGKLLSINTLGKRIKVPFTLKSFEHYLDEYDFGTAKLVKSDGKWFFHISATQRVEEFDKSTTKQVVGIDRGLRQIMTTYDSQGKTQFYSGKQIAKKRKHYKELRRSLQSHNTKSSKRRIRKLGQKENRWMNDVNHCLSKTLVDQYGANTVFTIEDLAGVSFERTNLSKKQQYDIRSWSFYQLEQFLNYKAFKAGSQVVKVAADYTSQRCPKCGRIDKDQRKKDIHEYQCACGYKSNDDRIGAMNIQLLGTQWVSGADERPRFEKLTVTR